MAAHWVDLHPGTDKEGRHSCADGTPLVDEFAAEELGCLLQVHIHAAHNKMSDAVNLRHRHPRLWDAVQALQLQSWVAVKVARMCAAAGLSLDQARWVDQVTSGYAETLQTGRFLALVEAKITEADPREQKLVGSPSRPPGSCGPSSPSTA